MGQTLITAALVAIAFGYTAWTLMPAAWRQALRRRPGAPGKPGATIDAGGCGGCSGCAGAAPGRRSTTTVITLHGRAAGVAQPPIKR